MFCKKDYFGPDGHDSDPFPARALQAGATQDFPEWEYWEETHEIPYSQGHYIIYAYTANDFDSATKTVAFEYPRSKDNLMILSYMGEEGLTFSPPLIRLFKNETVVYVATFTQGYFYTIQVENCSEDEQPYTMKTYPWDDSMWPTVTAGDTKPVTLGPGNTFSCMVKVPKSGLYTLTASRPELYAQISSTPDMNSHICSREYPQPVFLGYFQDERGTYISCYDLEADTHYGLEVFGGEEQCTGTFTLTAGAPNSDFGTLCEGTPLTLTIDSHDNAHDHSKKLVFKAEQSGRYCFYSDQTHSIRLRAGRENVCPE